MPACKGRWLHNDEGLLPVEPAGEPGQGKAGRIGRASWCDVTFLIQGELFPQKEILRGEGGAGTQAEKKEVRDIAQLLRTARRAACL